MSMSLASRIVRFVQKSPDARWDGLARRGPQLEKYAKQRIFGDLAPMVPPIKDMFDGPPGLENFKKNGEEYLEIYRTLCGLRPDEQVLDVGCGIGRKTIPLTKYLSEKGGYEGIDIVEMGVTWCQETITKRFSNFRFRRIDVYNKFYNPHGQYTPSSYKFPFADENFDFVVLGSVFTHMYPADIENYVSEISRVTRIGGRCLVTMFLLNEESLSLIKDGKSALDLRFDKGGYRTISEEVPELAIALPEKWMTELLAKNRLQISSLNRGSWCGRKISKSYQDFIVAVKS
jgi:SAM-dependent methyltransferase